MCCGCAPESALFQADLRREAATCTAQVSLIEQAVILCWHFVHASAPRSSVAVPRMRSDPDKVGERRCESDLHILRAEFGMLCCQQTHAALCFAVLPSVFKKGPGPELAGDSLFVLCRLRTRCPSPRSPRRTGRLLSPAKPASKMSATELQRLLGHGKSWPTSHKISWPMSTTCFRRRPRTCQRIPSSAFGPSTSWGHLGSL